GTPPYMAPEQVRGARATAASDVYSLGATLYAMLTGRPPFPGTGAAVLAARVAGEDPIPLRRLNPAVDRDAATICEKAMRWEPRWRYGSAREMAADIKRRLAKEPIQARSASWSYRAFLLIRRNPRPAAAACLALLLGFAASLAHTAMQRSLTLDKARVHLAAGRPIEALELLDALPWLPFHRGAELVRLRVEALARTGRLGEAVVTTAGLPAAERRKTYDRLAEAARRQLEGQGALRDRRMHWTLLTSAQSALSGIDAFSKRPEVPLELRDSTRSVLEECAWLAIRSLLETGQDDEVIAIADELEGQRDAGVMAAAAERALGRSGESSRLPRVQDALNLWAERNAEEVAVRQEGAAAPSEGQREGELRLLDFYLPVLPSEEVSQVKRSLEIARRLRAIGNAVLLPSQGGELVHAKGRLDGDDRADDLAVLTSNEVRFYECTPAGLRERGAPISLGGAGRALAFMDLDGDDCDELLLGLFDPVLARQRPGTRPGSLRVLRLEAEAFVCDQEIGAWDATPADSPHAIAAGDLDGNGLPEVAIGMSSGGDDERKVLLIRDVVLRTGGPSARREIHTLETLPDDGLGSDVMDVFIDDFDGDGRRDIACATGPWKGWDIRFWRFEGGRAVGPFRVGPLGTFQRSLALDLDGAPPAEIFLAKTSYLSRNREVFPGPTHTGLANGAYLYRQPGRLTRRHVQPSLDAPGDAFLWFDTFGEEVTEPDRLGAACVSLAPDREGRPAIRPRGTSTARAAETLRSSTSTGRTKPPSISRATGSSPARGKAPCASSSWVRRRAAGRSLPSCASRAGLSGKQGRRGGPGRRSSSPSRRRATPRSAGPSSRSPRFACGTSGTRRLRGSQGGCWTAAPTLPASSAPRRTFSRPWREPRTGRLRCGSITSGGSRESRRASSRTAYGSRRDRPSSRGRRSQWTCLG
ncbi:MAG: hypothetical protein HY721_14070, partial [Planctomycetes bacterium]|nr:hypothetical protein [Planctomycetota bacterium]